MRRTDDHHVNNVMELALQRYEQELLDKEKANEKHLRDHRKSVHDYEKQICLDREKSKHLQEQTKQALQLQMQEKMRRTDLEKHFS